MWFLLGGIVLLLLWWADVGPVGQLHWGWVLLPFVLAAGWWALADAIGLTQRRASDKMDARKVARRQRDMEALGLDVRQAKRVRTMRDTPRGKASAPAARSQSPAPPPSPKSSAPAPAPSEPPRRDPLP